MEAELLCGICKKPFSCPILLPCTHNVCIGCAKTNVIQSGHENKTTIPPHGDQRVAEISDSISDDSGYVSVNELNHLYQAIGNIPCLKCPVCSRIFPLDARGFSGFPRNRLLENIVNRHYAKSNGNIYCQLCEKDPPAKASVMCEQCEVVYCDECCKTCHPSRGPLAKHKLTKPNAKTSAVRSSTINCGDHLEENNSMYCVACRIPVCYVCIEKGKHKGHEVKALGAIFKEQKGVVSSNILQLEQSTNQMHNYVNQLRANNSVIQENGLDFESIIVAQCDALIQFIQTRKAELLSSISKEVDKKIEQSNEQVSKYEKKMKEASALLNYSKEALNEVDPASFLLVANALINRITDVCSHWQNDDVHKTPSNMELDLTLDTSTAAQALQDLQFIELKAPCAPDIIPDQCSVTNNAITLCWKPRKRSCVEGYVVELDDGSGGNFIEVYRGNSLECTVQGLQFDSTYRARVKGVNTTGEGAPSDEVYLTTSDIAWFSMDKETAHPEIILSNDNSTATCTSYDDRVVLGNAGFSKGCHYWEITIDRYDGNPDPAIGVAMASTMKDTILGKDDKAWCMYIDSSRSWFRHNNEHSNRRDGGIEVGSVVGIFLDVGSHKVSFYLNDEKRGAIRLPNINEPLYPAFSLNRNVQITLHTGLEPPDSQAYAGRH